MVACANFKKKLFNLFNHHRNFCRRVLIHSIILISGYHTLQILSALLRIQKRNGGVAWCSYCRISTSIPRTRPSWLLVWSTPLVSKLKGIWNVCLFKEHFNFNAVSLILTNQGEQSLSEFANNITLMNIFCPVYCLKDTFNSSRLLKVFKFILTYFF